MFSWKFPYPSQRMPVLAKNVIATSQPLAAQAGLAMLARGGNAVDAGLAAAITLAVVEPTSNGIGSDVFAILWDGQRLVGLNASGRSPAGWTPERFAERIALASRSDDGALTAEDLTAHRADWIDPISVEYRGYHLHEMPPNGQGIAALAALGMLRHFDLASFPVDSADSWHLQIEAMKLALADTWRNVTDPAAMQVTPAEMLDAGYLQERARTIDMKRTQEHKAGIPKGGGTVYLTAADEKGMMLSFIQSNYMGFGSGIVVPGTGISLQNRGAGFTLQRGHPNDVGPKKRPFQTIIPGFLTRNGQPVMSFGVMGGNMQAQGHVQMVVRLVDYNQNPQACSDGARWIVNTDFTVSVEDQVPATVEEELAG